jgi:hypothetical protein
MKAMGTAGCLAGLDPLCQILLRPKLTHVQLLQGKETNPTTEQHSEEVVSF